MNRGELWIAAGGGDYAGKPRPVVILRENRFDETPSVTVRGLTTDETSAPLLRIPLSPCPGNGSNERCHVMPDKITTIRRDRLHRRIGFLGDTDMQLIGAQRSYFSAWPDSTGQSTEFRGKPTMTTDDDGNLPYRSDDVGVSSVQGLTLAHPHAAHWPSGALDGLDMVRPA